MKKSIVYGAGLTFILGFWGSPANASPRFLDLSRAANMGLTESLDSPVSISAIHDTDQKNGLNYLPVGPQTFRGIPFLILEPSKNGGDSFVVLKGQRKRTFPEAVSIPADHLKASYLYFLHTCRWGGTDPKVTVAEYDILYDDGQVAVIPLRVGLEFTNFWGADDTSTSYLAWWYKYKYAEMGISLFPWKNPRPEEPIQSILFKSAGKMPVPILFAITASDKEISISEVSPKPEKTFQTDTSQWIPFEPPNASPAGTATDMSSWLDAPAGKHGALKRDGDKLVFEDGAKARFWGIKMSVGGDADLLNVPGYVSNLADVFALLGFNLVSLDVPANIGVTVNFKTLLDALKSKGIYLELNCQGNTGLSSSLASDPGIIPQILWSTGKIYRNFLTGKNNLPLEFQDAPMVMCPENSIPLHLAFGRSLENPYEAEWFDGWPNEFLGETPFLMAAFGCSQNWMSCTCRAPFYSIMDPKKSESLDFSLPRSIMVQLPVGALAYLRGDLKEGNLFVLKPSDNPPDRAAALEALAHRSGSADSKGAFKTDRTGELKAKIQEKYDSFVSDTGQISWQGNVGVVKIDSPRFQALIGFLANRKFNDTCWSVDTPNLFASISVISLTKTVIPVSDHLLVTGVTRMENTGMVYNQAKTKVLDPGKAPILMEPLKAKIVLYRYKKDPKLKVKALDANGQALKINVPVKWTQNSLAISWVPTAFYLEITK